MAITPSDFLATIAPAPVNAVLGMSANLVMTFSNTSLVDTGYNLSITVVLPNGVSYNSSSIPPTSIASGPSDTIVVNWVNLKDLAPNELGYTLTLTVNSDTNYRGTGNPVDFNKPIVTIDMTGSVDTLPRGSDDPGNKVVSTSANSDLIPLRYNMTKDAPGKMPKGAGLLSSVTGASWPFSYTLKVENNTPLLSIVSIRDSLPNGVAFLNQLTVSGPDMVALSSVTIIPPSPGQNYTALDWTNVKLSADSVNYITYEVAIWDNYTLNGIENSGSPILHGTPLTNRATISGISGDVTATATTNAMDALIIKEQKPSVIDVGSTISYSITYEVNQYDAVDGFTVTDTMMDGQTYDIGSAVPPPISVTVNLDGTTTLVWALGNLPTNSKGLITYTSTVDATFSTGAPVVTADSLGNQAASNGTNASRGTPTPDQAGTQAIIEIPSISKTILNYYYADGSVKPEKVASPGDSVEFQIVYDATTLTAEQADIYVDDYAPFNMGPLTDTLPIVYGGTLTGPFDLVTLSPNGLRWHLGTLKPHTLWSATFRIKVQDIVFSGTENNLAKLAGYNTEGLAFSDRAQVGVKFGEPNIKLSKTIDPPTSVVKPGEHYTYSIVISNLQNADNLTTDAYHMTLTDVIPTGLTLQGWMVSGTGSYDPPVTSGQNISMLIKHLAPGDSLTLSYLVEVNKNIPAGITLTNNAILTQPYSQPDLSFQYPGKPFTASVSVDVISLSITKTGKPTPALVGDYISYVVTIVVPKDTVAYTPTLTDLLPVGQTYYGPSTVAILPDLPSPVSPTPSGQYLYFPALANITATGADVSIIYTFVTEVTSSTHIPPYSELQPNTGTVNWAVASGWPLDHAKSSTFPVTVNTPHLDILKEQKNLSQGGAYTTNPIVVKTGDVIQYQLTITSDGASSAYGIVLSDILSNDSAFGAITSGPSVGTVTPPGPPPGAVLIWDIDELPVGQPATLEFTVTLSNTPAASQQIKNEMQGSYDTNLVNPYSYPVASNIVVAQAPALALKKSVWPTTAHVGDTVTYVLTLTVPADVDACNVVLSDVLPAGQTYAGNAKRNYVSITPTFSAPTVTFPTEAVLGPYPFSKEIVYSFMALVTSAQPPYPETQTDTATVNWDLTPKGPAALPVSSQADLSVNPKLPARGIDSHSMEASRAELLGDWDIGAF